MRQERMGGNLAAELRGPPARDRCATLRTRAGGSNPVIFDLITEAPDERGTAVRTACVFEAADAARQVAGIDVAQAGTLGDLYRPQKVLGLGVGRIGHLVVLMVCRHVPGDIGRDTR